MTVNTTNNKITYIANGSTTVWGFPFPGIDPAFIEVTIVDTLGNIISLPSNTFTVTLDDPIDPNPTSQSGSVVYPLSGPPLAAGSELTIVRNLPAVQTVSISNQSIVYPPIIEQEFDYLTLLTQSAGGTIPFDFSRAFRVGPLDPAPAIVPPVAVRAGQAAFFDGQGNLTPGTIPGSGVFISAVMIPVVEAATLPLARDNMGITDAINALFSTGDLKPTHKTIADPGWVLWADGTIGNVGSGSSIRQDLDTEALFALYFNFYSDATCPIFTSAGTATTRAAQIDAATAFAAPALCRMALPKGASRSLGVSGQGTGLTNRVLGSAIGTETGTPSIDTMAIHNHPYSPDLAPLAQFDSANNFDNMLFQGEFSISGVNIGNKGGGQPYNLMQPTTYINVMVKL